MLGRKPATVVVWKNKEYNKNKYATMERLPETAAPKFVFEQNGWIEGEMQLETKSL
jgi:hypothetical protein